MLETPVRWNWGSQFRSDVSGITTGLRFYKATGNTGAHIGNLWTSTGTLLGTVAFANETASGWQEANFAMPIAIAANTTYVVSYFTPTGHYSADRAFFTSTGVGTATATRAGHGSRRTQRSIPIRHNERFSDIFIPSHQLLGGHRVLAGKVHSTNSKQFRHSVQQYFA